MRRRLAFLATGLAALALVLAGAGALAQDARERLERLNLRETALSAEQGRNLNQLSRLLSVLLRLRRDPPPALLVSPGDAKDAVRAAILVRAMAPELQARARAHAAEAGEIARQRRLAAVASEALFQADSAAADRTRSAPVDPQGADLRGYAPAPAPYSGPLVAPERLLPPVPGPRVQAFGARLAGGGRANGLTLRAPGGAVVESPGAGLVQYVGPVKGWDVILILRMAGGYHLVLAGLEGATVGPGQSVAAGSPVGRMAEGRHSATDLYIEVRERGAPVDPERWMKIDAG